MSTHILAIHTYGSHRVKDPQTQETVSAHKIGYTSAAADLLLALYGDYAQDVSSSRTSYRYIHITGETTVRYGYLLLKLSNTELAQVEALAKLHHRAGAYLYRDNKWYELPNQRNTDYALPSPRTGPTFNPTGYRVVTPSTGEKEAAIERIAVEVSQRSLEDKPWHWLSGNTYPHRDLLRNEGARWSKKRRAWYFIGWELPEAIQQLVNEHKPTRSVPVVPDDAPCSDEEAEQILGVKLLPKPTLVQTNPAPKDDIQDDVSNVIEDDEKDTEDEEIPAIRIIKPQFSSDEPDAVQTAIQQVKIAPVVRSIVRSQHPTRSQLPQEACGELTGSITGQVWCYGYAAYDGICIFVNMGGPRMAVEAIRAKLSKGDIVNLIPEDAPAIELTAGEGNTGMYTDYLHNMPEAKFTSLMLAHEMLVEPNYGGKSTTFIFHLSDEQAMAQLKHHVTELVNVPVFNNWSGYLWQAGQSAMLLRKTRSNDCLKLWTVDLDVDSWTRIITGGLSEGIIQLPEQV